MSYSWKPRPPRRPNGWITPVAIGLAAAAGFWVTGTLLANRPVLTPGPCVMLGLATADGLDGPHLVVDCDGVQFGVKAVLP